jgi:hypothetical protein
MPWACSRAVMLGERPFYTVCSSDCMLDPGSDSPMATRDHP